MPKLTNGVGTILFSVFLAHAAFASGGMEGGGGKTVVCRNPDGSIRSAEILDLYEGRTIDQLPYSESSTEWKTQAHEILKAGGIAVDVYSNPPNEIPDYFRNVLEHMVFLPDGTALEPIDDSLEAIIPKGCALEQTVNYLNDRQILVDRSIWDALSATQKAALVIHEAIYRYLRRMGETDSRRARHLTAHLVSGHKIEDTYPGDGYKMLCSSGNSPKITWIYVIPLPPSASGETPKLRFYFGSLDGRWLMSRTYMDLDLNLPNSDPSKPPRTLLDQLQHPDRFMMYQSIPLQSLFEAGDLIDLYFTEQNGKWVTRIEGTSVVDGSKIGPVDLTCD